MAGTFLGSRVSARSNVAMASFQVDLLAPLKFHKATQPRIARSTASGLLGRSRLARNASALTSSAPSELATRDSFELQLAGAASIALEPVGPDLGAGLGRDELGVDLDLVDDTPNAAFKHGPLA
jgi:hypothetical protein